MYRSVVRHRIFVGALKFLYPSDCRAVWDRRKEGPLWDLVDFYNLSTKFDREERVLTAIISVFFQWRHESFCFATDCCCSLPRCLMIIVFESPFHKKCHTTFLCQYTAAHQRGKSRGIKTVPFETSGSSSCMLIIFWWSPIMLIPPQAHTTDRKQSSSREYENNVFWNENRRPRFWRNQTWH